jgi:hypothetical protein
MTTKTDIRTACEELLNDWNRSDWMSENGEWNDDDEIEEGIIDPDVVSDGATDLEIGTAWQGWDCHEGWGAYRVGTALYLRWWRNPTTYLRHDRDLWVKIDDEFFESESESAD